MARLAFAILALGLAASAHAQKPILPDFHADPSAHEWDGRYWIYPSHDLPGSKDWDMVDWHAFSSTDLVSWTDHGSTSKSPLGPFEYRGVFMDNRSRNVHHSIVEFGGQWYLFYHVQGPSWFERRVTAEYLEHGPDGAIRPVAMTKEGVRAKRPPSKP